MKKYNITVNGTTYEVEVEEVGEVASVPAPAAAAPVSAPAPKKAAAPAGATPVTSPMPGTILEVKCAPGKAVKRGETLFILEAMKMENEIPAPADGVVASVDVQKGASVASGAVIATLK